MKYFQKLKYCIKMMFRINYLDYIEEQENYARDSSAYTDGTDGPPRPAWI